jgi:uncharacterized protein (UPF0264 family)
MDEQDVAGLLVSVRSVAEALAALEGGASVIDVKEPDRGPLGRAEATIWSEVRRVVPKKFPVSAALGELAEWRNDVDCRATATHSASLNYVKLGLAGAGLDWAREWADLRKSWGPGPAWVAVAYADFDRAASPHPEDVLTEALRAPDCAGILVDTWDKAQPSPIEVSESWRSWFRQARQGGLSTALAGRLDESDIVRLRPLDPDLFAVRGAACQQGDRRRMIDPERVARLARAASPGPG